jgi:hypothetical protein
MRSLSHGILTDFQSFLIRLLVRMACPVDGIFIVLLTLANHTEGLLLFFTWLLLLYFLKLPFLPNNEHVVRRNMSQATPHHSDRMARCVHHHTDAIAVINTTIALFAMRFLGGQSA